MSFADPYLEKISLDPSFTGLKPNPELSLVLAVPVCNEPQLSETISSVLNCRKTNSDVELIIGFNSSENDHPEVHQQNEISELELRELLEKRDPWIRTHIIKEAGIPAKDAGAGYARKRVMDHALARFNDSGNPKGVIVSLDADTLCEPDYLLELEKHFHKHPRSPACSVYFEHPVKGDSCPPEAYAGIIRYELHLRYYIEGLRYAGHPHAFHTVGSAFAVRAGIYASQGGMNRRSAGEDFYFLQKIIPLGGYTELNSTCLHPSPRPSDRVVFGTGPVISRFVRGEITEMETYDPQCFEDLRRFLSRVPELYTKNTARLQEVFRELPDRIRENLEDEFLEKLLEINRNSASQVNFRKRFFNWFNMFRTLKYINWAHETHLKRMPAQDAVQNFLGSSAGLNKYAREEPLVLLYHLRKKQRSGNPATG